MNRNLEQFTMKTLIVGLRLEARGHKRDGMNRHSKSYLDIVREKYKLEGNRASVLKQVEYLYRIKYG